MEKISQKIMRTANRTFTDPREKLPSVKQSIYRILKWDNILAHRLYEMFNLARRALPDKAWEIMGLSKTSLDLSHLPLDLTKYQLKQRVGSGYQYDCFLFEPREKQKGKSWVLKVFQHTDNDLTEVQNKAKQVQDDYRTLCDWYQDIENLIPKQVSFISESFQESSRKPVLVVLQEFLGLEIRDVLEDFSEKEWEELCQKNPQIREQLKKFLAITQTIFEQYDKMPDLLGIGNLVVAKNGNDQNLAFLDPDGINTVSEIKERDKIRYKKILESLKRRAGVV